LTRPHRQRLNGVSSSPLRVGPRGSPSPACGEGTEAQSDTEALGGTFPMARIEISHEVQAEFMQSITQVVVAAAGDKQRAAELFAESLAGCGKSLFDP